MTRTFKSHREHLAANADELFVMKVDPTGKLAYSTLVPGNVPDDETVSFADTFIPYGIVVDQAGNAAVAGAAGLGLPTTPGVLAPQMPNPNSTDWSAGFLLQLNSTASAVQLATYLPSTYVANALAVDSKGTWLIATGHTVMKLDPKATEVMASTSIGSMVNFGAIALDAQEDVILGGSAWDESFPMQNPLISIGQNLGGSPETGYQEDMILAELSPDLSTLKFGSYLSAPSTSIDSPGSTLGGIAVDPSGDLVVAGTTYSQVFPTTAGTFESQLPAGAASGTAHGFVAKINLATPAGALCAPDDLRGHHVSLVCERAAKLRRDGAWRILHSHGEEHAPESEHLRWNNHLCRQRLNAHAESSLRQHAPTAKLEQLSLSKDRDFNSHDRFWPLASRWNARTLPAAHRKFRRRTAGCG